jgi:phosphatidylglycerophosphatase C
LVPSRRCPSSAGDHQYDASSVVGSEIAAFDVDGTLTRRDTTLPFLVRVAGRARVTAALARHAGLIAGALAARDRRDDAKAALVATLLAGRSLAELAAEGEGFAADIGERWARPDVVARLAWHREAGHEVVLVTASFALYTVPLGRRLGATRVEATELEVDAAGMLTGRLAGANCRGDEKVRRLAALYGDPPLIDWAYGNSEDDRAMLARARHAIQVGQATLAAVPT